jgi:GNAT superfamily N-acetyltransferase
MPSILSFDELRPDQRRLAPGVDVADGDPPSMPERTQSARVGGRPLQSYEALYLLERGVPLSRVASVRLDLRTVEGSEVVCGIADVGTRPDAVRRGFARSLLRETHRRAREEGVQWSFLWTRRSWGAHRAYEVEGYRDLYSSAVAYRKVPRAASGAVPPAGSTLRAARSADAPLLEELLHRATRDRVGFVPRAEGTFRVRFRLGWRRAADHRILFSEGAPVGYALVIRRQGGLHCPELVTVGPVRAGRWLSRVETLAGGRWLAFANTTFLRDGRTALERSGYAFVGRSHSVLMACPLTSAARRRWRELRAMVADPRFSLHGGDMF